ncbi:MAG: hypothetical protein OSJ66_05000 [Clostridia bacterium]|nr:hypothetical protein [Clostridia bacterium]
MVEKKKKANFIIILIVVLLLVLLIVLQMLVSALKKKELEENSNISVSTGTDNNNKRPTTVKEIIENAGSSYLYMNQSVMIRIYADFKYDLYDENGNSKEKYFMDIVDQIVELQQNSFYLIDEEKKFEIFVNYDKIKEKYTVKINDIEDFYDESDGDLYLKISKTKIAPQKAFGVSNDLYGTLFLRGMRFANTIIVTGEREELPNGYYKYPTEHIKAKLGGNKVLNLIFDEDYEGEIAPAVHVKTKLEDVEKVYKDASFGSSKEGYLGYRSPENYIFLYEDEVSIYPYKYEANEYFDKYLSDYCETGNLDKLVSDFTTQWSSYFEFEYDGEKQDLKLIFPTRGIGIDIVSNDSKGITIYNNYYLTDTVKNLIKANKITLEPDKDLLFMTEQKRRESMK